MTFRARLTLVAAAAVALAIVVASVLVFFVVRERLRDQVDDALRDRAEEISHMRLGEIETPSGDLFLQIRGPALGGAGGYVQVVKSDGATLRPPEETVEIPVAERVLDVARSGRRASSPTRRSPRSTFGCSPFHWRRGTPSR